MSVHKAEIDIPVNINIKDYKTDMLEGKPVSILASDKFKTVDISIENDVLAGKISLTANLKQYVDA